MPTVRQIKELTAVRLGELPRKKAPKLPRKEMMMKKKKPVEQNLVNTLKKGSDVDLTTVVPHNSNTNPVETTDIFEMKQQRFPLKPLRWPTTKEEQLQLICTVRRSLRQLSSYLQINSSTLVEALPRMSVSGDGLVKVPMLHAWLCSLTQGNDSAVVNDDDFQRDLQNDMSYDVASEEVPENVVRSLRLVLDPKNTGRVKIIDLYNAFSIARRFALQRDAVKHQQPKKKKKNTGPQFTEMLFFGSSPTSPPQKQRPPRKKKDQPPVVLMSRLGRITEAEVYDVVDVLFSDSRMETGTAEELGLGDLETHVRSLRRVWATTKHLPPPSAGSSGTTTKEKEKTASPYDDDNNDDKSDSSNTPRKGDDQSEALSFDDGYDPSLDDGTWERLVHRVARTFAVLDAYLAQTLGLRFMEFVKNRCCLRGGTIASIDLLRDRLTDLFIPPQDQKTTSNVVENLAEKSTVTTLPAMCCGHNPAASFLEHEMTRLGVVGPFLRHVEKAMMRRGLKLGEGVRLLTINDDKTASFHQVLAFMSAVLQRRTSQNYRRSRERRIARDFEAKKCAEEKEDAENAFIQKMRVAEHCGVISSFAKLDRYFRRYQLTAEGMWKIGTRASRTDFTSAMGPEDFHDLLAAARVRLTQKQAFAIVSYLDRDQNGVVDFNELQDAIGDYRRWKRARRRIMLKRAHTEQRLFLEQQVTLLLQYLILIDSKNSETSSSSYTQNGTGSSMTTSHAHPGGQHPHTHNGPNSQPGLRPRGRMFGGGNEDIHVYQLNNVVGPEEQRLHVVDLQRTIDRSNYLALSQYFRQVRERLHSSVYAALDLLEPPTTAQNKKQSSPVLQGPGASTAVVVTSP